MASFSVLVVSWVLLCFEILYAMTFLANKSMMTQVYMGWL